MRVSVDISEYRKLLEARLRELTPKHDRTVAAWQKRMRAWHVAMIKWVRTNYRKRLADQGAGGSKRKSNSGRCRTSFDSYTFFDGAPEMPTRPEDRRIDRLKGQITLLRITTKKRMMVDSDIRKELLEDECC